MFNLFACMKAADTSEKICRLQQIWLYNYFSKE